MQRDKKKASESVNSLALNLLILTLREIVQFFVLNYNYFLTVSINRLQELNVYFVYLIKPGEPIGEPTTPQPN